MDIDLFNGFILYFLSHAFLIPLLIIGIFAIEREKFFYIALMMLFTVVFNKYLKLIWKIPLNPDLLLDGWAYPSGHTQINVVFWLSLYLFFRKPWIIFGAFIFLLLAFNAMLHFKFHNWEDIFGGVCFGITETLLLYLIINNLKSLKVFALFILGSTILLYSLLPEMPEDYYNSIWQSMGILGGLVLAIFINNHRYIKPQNHKYGMLYALCALSIMIIVPKVNLLQKSDALIKIAEGFSIISLFLFIVPLAINITTSYIIKFKKQRSLEI